MTGALEEEVRVTVLGSLVFDISVHVERMPQPHETVLARGATISAGGKGLCQAIAARRLGADVKVVGTIGDDMFGDYLVEVLTAEKIDAAHLDRHAAGTHLGVPILTADGHNRIIGVPRASFHMTADLLHRHTDTFTWAEVLLVQGETPLDTIRQAIMLTRPGTLVVWNPAPARFSLEEMASGAAGERVGWLTPNEDEASKLAGIPVTSVSSGLDAARILHERTGSKGVVVTLGARGAVAVDPEGTAHVSQPWPVRSVDPTAAGDTFSAAFAVHIRRGAPVPESLAQACAAGGLATTRVGAVPSIPHEAEVRALLAQGVPG